MLLYENKYFVEKIEIRKNMLKDLTVSLMPDKLLKLKNFNFNFSFLFLSLLLNWLPSKTRQFSINEILYIYVPKNMNI